MTRSSAYTDVPETYERQREWSRSRPLVPAARKSTLTETGHATSAYHYANAPQLTFDLLDSELEQHE